MHIYDYTDIEKPFLSDERSFTKVRDDVNLYPSVTTITKYIPNDFINDIWLPKTMIELKELNPHLDWKEIKELSWGIVDLPVDKEDPVSDSASSSEFGTLGHKAIEDLIRRDIFKDDTIKIESRWEDFVRPVLTGIQDELLTPVYVEKLVCCHFNRVAGTIDLIARDDNSGRYVLLDYKFRKPTKNKPQPRDTDCAQLAIEADMFAKEAGLSYIPKICTVVVDNTTGNPTFIWYSPEKTSWAKELFEKTRDMIFLYNKI